MLGPMSDVTRLLDAAKAGEPHAAAELLPLVYAELRRLAASRLSTEKPGQTLEPTALVHEAYLRLVGAAEPGVYRDRGHFFAAAAAAMRRILVDQARRKHAEKRGGGQHRKELDDVAAPASDDELLALNDALDRLAAEDPQKARLVELRYFAGLTNDQAASALGISPRTGDRHWAYARAWLQTAVRGS
ncbi:MAG TPA: sigma-70 family RNA polymerase sigma factor [Gemmataceae bacterium]|nr:sigma-70 family RNA polymerase sigma factor [Gemmataceae bacterium]